MSRGPTRDARTALVTGASRGIGRATALALAQRGVRVIGVARSAEALQELAEVSGVEPCAVSLADEHGCREAVAAARDRLGHIDILVNNAGSHFLEEAPIWEQPIEVWHQTFAVNTHAPFLLTRMVCPDMMQRRWGRIITVASTAAQLGASRLSAYVSSKHAVVGLMRAAAQDLGPFGVTCNAVLPGWVRTPMSERTAAHEAKQRGVAIDEVWRERASGYPAGRVLSSEEVADVIVFLAGEQASGINGEAITIALGSPW